MERKIEQHPDILFYNATEGGARIRGTQELTLQEFVLSLLKPHPITEKLLSFLAGGLKDEGYV